MIDQDNPSFFFILKDKQINRLNGKKKGRIFDLGWVFCWWSQSQVWSINCTAGNSFPHSSFSQPYDNSLLTNSSLTINEPPTIRPVFYRQRHLPSKREAISIPYPWLLFITFLMLWTIIKDFPYPLHALTCLVKMLSDLISWLFQPLSLPVC